jgi:hypothetical protein
VRAVSSASPHMIRSVTMTKQARLSYDGGNVVVPVRIDQEDFAEGNPPTDLTGAFLALLPSNPQVRLSWHGTAWRWRSSFSASNLPFTNETAAPQAESVRPAVLDCRSARLDQLVRSARSRQARDGNLMASRRLPPVLEMAVSSSPSWPPEGDAGSPRLNPPHEKREPELGCTSHSWRIASTWFRYL